MSDVRVPTLDDLQGEWKLVRVGRNGHRAPFLIPWLIKVRFQIRGNRYARIARGKTIETGRIRLKPDKDFSLIDEHIEDGCDADKRHRGIICLIGHKLEHLQAEIGDPRPTGFPCGKDTRASMALMKRV